MSDRCGTATRRRIAGIMAVACLVAVAIIASAADRPAAALDATTTPEAVLVDRERRIRYAGRIDDRYKIHGVMTPGDAEPESRNATEELLAGRAIREPRTKPAGCPLDRPERPTQSSTVAAGAPTFHTNVVPFLHTHCQICHAPGQAGPFNLLTYDDAVEWMELGLEELDARRMPPAQIASDLDYAGPKSPTAAEIAMLRAWVKAGKPEGNPAEAPQLDARARAGERGAIGGHAPPARGPDREPATSLAAVSIPGFGRQFAAFLCREIETVLAVQVAVFRTTVEIGFLLREAIGGEVPAEIYRRSALVSASYNWLAAVACAALGLVVSACVRSTDKGVLAVPLLVTPQILFGGTIIPIKGGVLKLLAMLFAPLYWAYRGCRSEGDGVPTFWQNLGAYDPALWIPYAALAAQILVATVVTIMILRWQERAALGRNRSV